MESDFIKQFESILGEKSAPSSVVVVQPLADKDEIKHEIMNKFNEDVEAVLRLFEYQKEAIAYLVKTKTRLILCLSQSMNKYKNYFEIKWVIDDLIGSRFDLKQIDTNEIQVTDTKNILFDLTLFSPQRLIGEIKKMLVQQGGDISDVTLKRFKYFCSSDFILRELDEVFQSEGVRFDRDFVPNEGGERRDLAAKYLNTMDFSSYQDTNRFLRVLSTMIKMKGYREANASRTLKALLMLLHTDGFIFDFDTYTFTHDTKKQEMKEEEKESPTSSKPISEKDYDVFICHVSEDQDSYVRGLAKALSEKGILTWYAETEIKWGDSLRDKIEKGLAHSKYGIVVISKTFLKKESRWTKQELDGLFARGIILPIWHGISEGDLLQSMPSLAEKFAKKSTDPIDEIAQELKKMLGRQ